MDIQKEKWDYTAMLVAEDAITQDQCDTLKLSDGMNLFYSEHLASTTIDCINWGWLAWLKAKAQVVPEGFVAFPKKQTSRMRTLARDFDARLSLTKYEQLHNIWVKQAMIEAQELAND